MAPDSNRTFKAKLARFCLPHCVNYRPLRISRTVPPFKSRITTHRFRITTFARATKQCETRSMRKLPNIAVSVLAATIFLAGTAAAQQTPATKPAAASSQSGSAGQTAGAAKTPSGTAAKSSTGAAAQHHPAAAPLVLKTDKDKESYAIGMNIGKSIHRDGVDVDPNILLRGMKDAIAGGKTVLTEDEAKTVMTNLQANLRKDQAEKAQLAGEANKKAGDAF